MSQPPESPNDAAPLLAASAGLYGRDNQRTRLLACLEQACAYRPQLLLIHGASGIGKTALVRETCQPVADQQAFFLTGKFDQLQHGIPYSAWSQALNQLMDHLLAHDAGTDQPHWRDRLSRQLGAMSSALEPVVPRIKALVPTAEASVRLPASETRERFHKAFLQLMRVFAQAECPLVIFLDDIQWMDRASAQLMSVLLKNLEPLPLLLVAAYRTAEIGPGHPLPDLLADTSHSTFAISELELGPLDSGSVGALLAHAMQRPEHEVAPLAEFLFQSAQGNPFFTWQLLRNLRDQGVLGFDSVLKRWHWSADALKARRQTDHISELVRQRLARLPEPTRELLAWGACIGQHFNAGNLAQLTDQSVENTRQWLEPAQDDGFIVQADTADNYSFTHDRMQEVAYASISGRDRPGMHSRIARALLQSGALADQAINAIQIADHMNRSASPADDPGTLLARTRMNLQAARQAKRATAFDAALSYVQTAMSRLPRNIWTLDADLAYSLYCERGETEYLNGNLEAAERFFLVAIEHEPDILRKADLYHRLIVQYTLAAMYNKAVSAGRQGLRLFGIALPQNNLPAHQAEQMQMVADLLEQSPLERLHDLPPMRDPNALAIMKILASLGPPCYRARPHLWAVIVPMQLQLCLNYGYAAHCSYTFPAFGGLLMHRREGNGKIAQMLCDATLHLMQKGDYPVENSVGYLMIGSSLRHWFDPLSQASQDYLQAYRIGQATGNLQYAVYGFGHNIYCRFFQGVPLTELIPEALSYLEYSRQRRNQWGIDLLTGTLRVFQLLHGPWSDASWPGQNDDESVYQEQCLANDNIQVQCIYQIMRAFALLLKGNPSQATFSLAQANANIASVSVQGLLPSAIFPALNALAACDIPGYHDDSGKTAAHLLHEALAQYKTWQADAPGNFRHWYHLLRAERAAQQGATETALLAFDQALEAALEQSCWIATALVALRAQRFWEHRGHLRFATVYRHHLDSALRRGGAHALLNMTSNNPLQTAMLGTGPAIHDVIDLTNTLSSHTDMPSLLAEIAQQTLAHTGCTRVALLVADDETLGLALDARGDQLLRPQPPVPLGAVSSLPVSLLQHVWQTGRALRFDHHQIGSTPLLSNDPWLNSHAKKGEASGSSWCSPVIHQGAGIGVLYTEWPARLAMITDGQTAMLDYLITQSALMLRSLMLVDALSDHMQSRRKIEQKIHTADTEIAMRRGMEERLKHLLHTDVLTDLPNRRFFFEQLKQYWYDLSDGRLGGFSLIMIDIDHFKQINDMHGHGTGDEVLRHIARVFRENLRSNEIPARLGGEEFALLMKEVPAEHAGRLAERLCEQLRNNPFRHHGKELRCTISVGVAQTRPSDTSFEDVLQRGDKALYQAKANGRNRVATS